MAMSIYTTIKNIMKHLYNRQDPKNYNRHLGCKIAKIDTITQKNMPSKPIRAVIQITLFQSGLQTNQENSFVFINFLSQLTAGSILPTTWFAEIKLYCLHSSKALIARS